MTATLSKSVLLLGDYEHREFREAVQFLADRAELHRASNPQEALDMLPQLQHPPMAIVAVQARPGKYSQAEIARLHAAAPLAKLAVLLGSWCEGETRTGHPWAGVRRVYWHQAMGLWRDLLAAVPQHTSSWDLPRTATDAERLLYDVVAGKQANGKGLIAISAETTPEFDILAEACRADGYSAAWLDPREPPRLHGIAAALCDLPRLNGALEKRLQSIVEQLYPAPVLAVVGFPRWEDRQQLLQLGTAGVVSKPFLLAELHTQLAGAIQRQKSTVRMPTAA